MRFKVLNSKKAKIAAACFWILLISLAAEAANAQQYFKKWTTADGLPQNNVINIAQTPDGYLWVATLDGLARFDGVRFKVFNKSNTPEMPNNRIFAMFTDADGRLWFNYVGDQTVVVYENGKFKRFEKGRDFEKDENLTPNARYGIEYYRHLLAKPEMTFRAGENKYVYEKDNFAARPARNEGEFPAKVFATDDKTVWIDEADAIYHIEDEKVTRYPKNEPLPVAPKNTIPMDYAEKDGVVWCAAGLTLINGKLISFKDGKVKIFRQVSQVYELEFDAKGNLLIADYKGLIKVDAQTVLRNDALNFPVSNPAAEKGSKLFRDRDGNIWLGGFQGLYLINSEQAVTFYSEKSQPPIDNVYSIVQDAAGTVWFAAWTNNRLFSYRDGVFKSEYGYILTSLYVDSRSRLWKGNGSNHVKSVFAVRQMRKISRPARSGFRPFFVQIFKTIAKTHSFCADKLERRIIDFERDLIGIEPNAALGNVERFSVNSGFFD